jgi:morphogenetic protein associated with SpoVID
VKLHIVQPGDTIWSVARRYDIPIERLLQANDDLGDSDRLEPGTKVRIPTGKVPVSLHKTDAAAVRQERSQESSSSQEAPLERPVGERAEDSFPSPPAMPVPPMPEAPQYQPQMPAMTPPYFGWAPDSGRWGRSGCGCGGKRRYPSPLQPMMPGPPYPQPGYGYPVMPPGRAYPQPGYGYPMMPPGRAYPQPGYGYPMPPGQTDPQPGYGYPMMPPGQSYPSPGLGTPVPGGTDAQQQPASDGPESPQASIPPLPLESSEEMDGQLRQYAELFRDEQERESSSAEL